MNHEPELALSVFIGVYLRPDCFSLKSRGLANRLF
jgi:hypothetical protein